MRFNESTNISMKLMFTSEASTNEQFRKTVSTNRVGNFKILLCQGLIISEIRFSYIEYEI